MAGELVAAADAIGDRMYVLLGDAVGAGMPSEQIFDELLRSNTSKAIQSEATVKRIKGAHCRPPNLRGLLGIDSK